MILPIEMHIAITRLFHIIRATGAVLAIDEENLRQVIQLDPELSELMMRAFILRRMGLVSSGQGQVMVIGSRHSAGTLELREFLTRNAYPYASIDVDEDADVQALLDRFHVAVDDIPVVIGHCGRVFRHPTIADIASYLNMNPAIDEARIHDVVVAGAGPARLAAAVYAASEGLDVVVVSRRRRLDMHIVRAPGAARDVSKHIYRPKRIIQRN